MRRGQLGTKDLLAWYGKRLVCVRYRYDEPTKQRIETVELIVDRTEWTPEAGTAGGDTVVALRVGRLEYEVKQQVKAAGGSGIPESGCGD